MRVAFVTNICTHYRLPLFEELARRHEVDFFFTSRGKEWYWPSDHRVQTGTLNVKEGGSPLRLAGAIARGGYDCVVSSLAGRLAPPAVFATAAALRLPLVLWVGIWQHPDTRFHRLTRPLTRSLYRAAPVLAVYGSHVADYVRAESGRDHDVVVVPQAMNVEAYREQAPAAEIDALRAELQLASPTAIFVGRLEREKGIDVMLEAVAHAPAVRTLLLVGAGSLEQTIAEAVLRRGLADRVRMVGYVPQPDLPRLMQAADFLVLPSVATPVARETWGFVVNEAMAAGLPVVATDAVGAAAGGLVVDGDNGLVVPERDPEALAAAMNRLATDEAFRARAGEAAAAHVARWSYAAAADAFEDAMRRAVVARGGMGDASPART